MSEYSAAKGWTGLLRNPITEFRFDRVFRALSSRVTIPFELILNGGTVHRVGEGPPRFKAMLKNERAIKAIASFDEGQIADSYLSGDIDIQGELPSVIEACQLLRDFHPVASTWRFLQPILQGQVRTNRDAIEAHYDIDQQFFLSFLDPQVPCYTQGVYHTDGESLDAATLRKFSYCFDQLKLRSGDRILEIGPGWGAWFQYASARGVKCTGITISRASEKFLNERAKQLGYDWEIVFSDFFDYDTQVKFDAIVIMGVIEHLPNYKGVVQKFQSLLKQDGRIFLDGSACDRKYELSSFMVKHIYPGNHSFLVLPDFLQELAKTSLRLVEIFNDRYSYFLTFRQWAKNFDRNRESVIARFGQFNYRRFQLYLWGAAYEFLRGNMECYRMVIQNSTRTVHLPKFEYVAPGG